MNILANSCHFRKYLDYRGGTFAIWRRGRRDGPSGHDRAYMTGETRRKRQEGEERDRASNIISDRASLNRDKTMFTTRALKTSTQRLLQGVPVKTTCGAKRTLITTARRTRQLNYTGGCVAGKMSMGSRQAQIRFNSITASTDGTTVPEDVAKLSVEEYHTYADQTFEQILEELDAFFEENRIMEAEVDEEAGVMEINCSEGTYVINKQPPTKQIWLSSPISGPKRFDYHLGKWICLRDGVKLSDLLQNEMSQMYGDFKWSSPF